MIRHNENRRCTNGHQPYTKKHETQRTVSVSSRITVTAADGVWFGLLDKEAIRQAVPAGLVTAAAAVWLATAVDVAVLRKPFGMFLLFTGAMTLLQTKQKK